jgi:hypothetical protein
MNTAILIILTVLGIGLLLLILVGAIVIGLVKKGAKSLFAAKRHRFSSGGFFGGHGHRTYGYRHYKHSRRSFFSS